MFTHPLDSLWRVEPAGGVRQLHLVGDDFDETIRGPKPQDTSELATYVRAWLGPGPRTGADRD